MHIFDFPHSDMSLAMRHAHSVGWHVIRGFMATDTAGQLFIRLFYVEKANG